MSKINILDDAGLILKRLLRTDQLSESDRRTIQVYLSAVGVIKKDVEDYVECHTMLGRAGVSHGGPVSRRIRTLLPDQPKNQYPKLTRLLNLINRTTGRSKKIVAERIHLYRESQHGIRRYDQQSVDDLHQLINYALRLRHTNINVHGNKGDIKQVKRERRYDRSYRVRRADKSLETA
jgi:hypothetical protein